MTARGTRARRRASWAAAATRVRALLALWVFHVLSCLIVCLLWLACSLQAQQPGGALQCDRSAGGRAALERVPSGRSGCVSGSRRRLPTTALAAPGGPSRCAARTSPVLPPTHPFRTPLPPLHPLLSPPRHGLLQGPHRCLGSHPPLPPPLSHPQAWPFTRTPPPTRCWAATRTLTPTARRRRGACAPTTCSSWRPATRTT